MESLNQKLLKVFITSNIIRITNNDPYRIMEILQSIDPDIILLTVLFEKEYSLDELFQICDAIFMEDNKDNKSVEWFNNISKQELYDLKKDNVIFMIESLGASIRFKHAILNNLNEKNIDNFFEQIYNVFTKRYAYLFI